MINKFFKNLRLFAHLFLIVYFEINEDQFDLQTERQRQEKVKF